MNTPSEVCLSAKLQRKDPSLPVYLVIADRHIRHWNLSGTSVIEGTANGVPFGRRTIKSWGKGGDDWFVELTSSFCTSARLNVGDTVSLNIKLADMSTPEELESLFSGKKDIEYAWTALSESQRRAASEHIRAAKTQSTRERRAAAIAEKLRGEGK